MGSAFWPCPVYNSDHATSDLAAFSYQAFSVSVDGQRFLIPQLATAVVSGNLADQIAERADQVHGAAGVERAAGMHHRGDRGLEPAAPRVDVRLDRGLLEILVRDVEIVLRLPHLRYILASKKICQTSKAGCAVFSKLEIRLKEKQTQRCDLVGATLVVGRVRKP